MSESKMREALESLVKLHRKHFGLDGAWDAEITNAEYLLDNQPAAGVELTDAARYLPPRKRQEPGNTPVTARYGYVIGWNACLDAIAAHIAKQSGGVQRERCHCSAKRSRRP